MGELLIRLAGPGDAKKIFERMQEAEKECAASDWFCSDSLDYILEHMKEEKGFVAAAFDGEEAAGFLIVKYYEEGKENIVSFLNRTAEEERACAVMDSSAVGAAWRGRGLMRRLLRFGEQQLPKEKRLLVSTVHPDNVYSLRNLQALGFEPVQTICCYGGRTRLLLCKERKGEGPGGRKGQQMDTHALLEEIIKTAGEAGEILLGASGIRESSSLKAGHANLVTEYDKRVQRFLIERLRGILPEAHFVGEEDGSDVFLEEYERGYAFVIDPIDGTLNFVAGLKPSTVSIALLKDGEPFIGVICNPYDGVICHAVKGEGAFWNGERILSSGEPLSKSLVSFGTAPYYEELSRRGIELAYEYLHRGEDLRRSGSAAWDLCLIASGATGLYFELRLGLWDYAAGALIASEAGCRLTDIEGAPLAFRGPSSILCASRGVSREDYLPR